MFDNRPNETQYFYTDGDTAGAALNGNKAYEVTFAPGQEPPVDGFWSLGREDEPERWQACSVAADRDAPSSV